MKTITTILLLIVTTIFSIASAQEEDNKITAKIESQDVEGIIRLKAFATNETTSYQELNYLFVSIKKGNSGNLSNNKQSGKFTLKPDETKQLSEIAVNLQKSDALKVFLYIKDEQTQALVSKDSIIINGKDMQTKLSRTDESEIFELKGLTIDDTKTKIGKDFYDYFYLEYSKLPEKSTSSITISELPTNGRNSQISVEIDDKTINSFISNPNEDYLKEQASLTLKILQDYDRRKDLIRNEFRY